jgi:hypothetical protein
MGIAVQLLTHMSILYNVINTSQIYVQIYTCMYKGFELAEVK